MIIKLSIPPKVLSPNARSHWAPVARAKKAYRSEAYFAAAEAGIRKTTGTSVNVHLTLYPKVRRNRDGDNFQASMKAALDGISDALGIDDHLFKVTSEISDELGGYVTAEVEVVT